MEPADHNLLLSTGSHMQPRLQSNLIILGTPLHGGTPMNSSYKYAFLGVIVLCIVIVVVSSLNHQPPSNEVVTEVPSPTTAVAPSNLPRATNNTELSLEDQVTQRLSVAQQNLDAPRPVDRSTTGPKSSVKKVSNPSVTEVTPKTRTFGAPPPSLSSTIKPLVQSSPTQATSADVEAKPVAPYQTRARQYRIMPGDTFSNLAVRHFGNEKYWQAFAHANPSVNPQKLQVGQTIQLPDSKLVLKTDQQYLTTPSANTTIHVVRTGESLWTISKHHYGNVKGWRIIFNANREAIGSDPDRLTVGQKLTIPLATIAGNTSE